MTIIEKSFILERSIVLFERSVMDMKALRHIWILICIFAACSRVGFSATWFVDGTLPQAGDGTSWGDAFQAIQPALDAAQPGDEVWVRAGTYQENIQLSPQVSLYGGFSGTESILPERDFEVNETVIAGNAERSVVIGADDAVIDGFIITQGSSGEWIVDYGGGIECRRISIAIRNCRIEKNKAFTGGGIYCYDSTLELTACEIVGNQALVTHNNSGGGGIFLRDGMAEIAQCMIQENLCHEAGGGGLSSMICLCRITDTVFRGNVAKRGGGIHVNGFHAPRMERCLIVQNYADEGGGYCGEGDYSTLKQCTIAGNVGRNHSGGLYLNGSGIDISNSIVWQNAGGSMNNYSPRADLSIEFCCIEGAELVPGEGNMNLDPRFRGWGEPDELFVDARGPAHGDGSFGSPFPSLQDLSEYYDYTPAANSPCIGAGETGGVLGALGAGTDNVSNYGTTLQIAAGVYSCAAWAVSTPVNIQGDGAESTVIEGTIFGLVDGTVLKGLSITNGAIGGLVLVSDDSPSIVDVTVHGNRGIWEGAGVRIYDGSRATFTRVTIRDNRLIHEDRDPIHGKWEVLKGYGGGIYCTHSAPVFEGCTIELNQAYRGGGVYEIRSEMTFDNCIISGNKGRSGGGMFLLWGDVQVTGTSFLGNASLDGGGCYIIGDLDAGFEACAFAANTAESGGGALSYEADNEGMPKSGIQVTNSRFVRNSAGWGGAISAGDSWMPATFQNCLFARNNAWSGGIIILSEAGTETFRRCTLADNAAVEGEGAFHFNENVRRTLTIEDSILWNNGGFNTSVGLLTIEVTHSCIEGGEIYPGVGNINGNPMFRPSLAGDIHIDAHAEPGGDGSEGQPYGSIAQAVQEKDYALCNGSPCIGSAHAAGNMGANLGVFDCTIDGIRLFLAEGIYDLGELVFNDVFTIAGAGQDSTFLQGTVRGLSSGSVLRNVTIQSGPDGGMVVGSNVALDVEDCTIVGDGATPVTGVICGVNSKPVFRRCTIAGHVNEYGGGGVLCHAGSEPAFYGCTIKDNSAEWGGGIFAFEDHVQLHLEECTITRNQAVEPGASFGKGGGLFFLSESVSIVNCWIIENSAGSIGGGGFIECDVANIAGTVWQGNYAENRSGGLDLTVQGASRIDGCIFQGNEGRRWYCGGLYISQSDALVVSNSLFRGNRSPEGGGATLGAFGGRFEHCTFSLNTADEGGGLILYRCDGASFSNITMAHNTATVHGSDIFNTRSDCMFTDCILWGDGDESVYSDETSTPGLVFAHCCVKGEAVQPGEGNMNLDPRFVGLTGSDAIYVDVAAEPGGDGSREKPFHSLSEILFAYSLALLPDSPCVGTGSDGGNMGADWGIAEGAGDPGGLNVVIAEGRYDADMLPVGMILNLEGAGPDRTIIEGRLSGIRSGCTVKNLAIEPGVDEGIFVHSGTHPVFENVTVRHGESYGMYCAPGSAPVLNNCRFEHNQRGALFAEDAALQVSACRFAHVEHDVSGWALVQLKRCTGAFNDCTFGEATGRKGIALRIEEGEMAFEHCRFEGNTYAGIEGVRADISLTDCIIGPNFGTGIESLSGGNIDVQQCSFLNNGAPSIHAEGGTQVTVADSGFLQTYGIVVYDGALVCDDCLFERSRGALYLSGSTFRMARCRFRQNGMSLKFEDGTEASITDTLMVEGFAKDNPLITCDDAGLTMDRCTLANNVNTRTPCIVFTGGHAVLRNSIIWGNSPESIQGREQADIAYCCIGGEPFEAGEGNLFVDPRFARWCGTDAVYVNPLAAESGDGSEANPFQGLDEALAVYRYDLRQDSPCLGAGEQGTDMGAPSETYSGVSYDACVFHLMPGEYGPSQVNLFNKLSLSGASRDETIFKGTTFNMGQESALRDVTIRDMLDISILVVGRAVNLKGCRITRNARQIYCVRGSEVFLENCEIIENGGIEMIASGGGIYGEEADVHILGCLFQGNTAVDGGALSGFASRFWVDQTDFAGNTAQNNGSVVGYIDPGICNGLFHFSRCRFLGNHCETGALLNIGCADGSVENSIFAGNVGDLFSVTLLPSIVNNTFSQHTGSITSPASNNVIFYNSIFWKIDVGPEHIFFHCLKDADPLFVEEGQFDTSRFKTFQLDALDVQVPDFIISEGDYRLQWGSPAINGGGVDPSVAVDFDGNARPCLGAMDMGAAEYCSDPDLPPYKRGDVNSDDTINLGDAIYALTYIFNDGDRPTCLDTADANDDGKINLADAIKILDYLFGNTTVLPQPFMVCGPDFTLDELLECHYAPCAD